MLDLTPQQIWWNVVVIQTGAGVVGFISLHNARSEGLIRVDYLWWWGLRVGVVSAITLPWLLWLVFEASPVLVLRFATFVDLALLFFLLLNTGGPTASWFTPFLLAVTPLAVQLEPDKRFALLYLALSLFVFAAQLDLAMLKGVPIVNFANLVKPLNLPPNNNNISNYLYHSWYFWCTFLTGFFPTMIGFELISKVQKLLGR